MPIAIKPFDAARYIDDAETQAALFSDALATGDRRVILHILGIIARARGMTDLAKATGIGRTTLYAAIGEDANPTMDTFLKIVAALNLTLASQARETEPARAA